MFNKVARKEKPAIRIKDLVSIGSDKVIEAKKDKTLRSTNFT
jgi:hypothetical protein